MIDWWGNESHLCNGYLAHPFAKWPTSPTRSIFSLGAELNWETRGTCSSRSFREDISIMQEKLALAGYKGHPFEKGIKERGVSAPLPFSHHCVQWTGNGKKKSWERGANRKPEFAYEAVLCVNKKRPAISFYHIYIYTEITKHSILKDTLRDRQTSWATFLSREEWASLWEGPRKWPSRVFIVWKHVPGSWKTEHGTAGKLFTCVSMRLSAFTTTAESPV